MSYNHKITSLCFLIYKMRIRALQWLWRFKWNNPKHFINEITNPSIHPKGSINLYHPQKVPSVENLWLIHPSRARKMLSLNVASFKLLCPTFSLFLTVPPTSDSKGRGIRSGVWYSLLKKFVNLCTLLLLKSLSPESSYHKIT